MTNVGTQLIKPASLMVSEYSGEEASDMYHGTDSRSAQLIVRSQRFRISADPSGLLGKGVYINALGKRLRQFVGFGILAI